MNDIRKLLNEIDELNLNDENYKINSWYEYLDSYREKTYTFKVIGYEYDCNKKVRIKFISIYGDMEEIDPEDGYPCSFPVNCLFYDDSKIIPKEVVELRLKNRIKEIL